MVVWGKMSMTWENPSLYKRRWWHPGKKKKGPKRPGDLNLYPRPRACGLRSRARAIPKCLETVPRVPTHRKMAMMSIGMSWSVMRSKSLETKGLTRLVTPSA